VVNVVMVKEKANGPINGGTGERESETVGGGLTDGAGCMVGRTEGKEFRPNCAESVRGWPIQPPKSDIGEEDFEHFLADAGMDLASGTTENGLFAVKGGLDIDTLWPLINGFERPDPCCQQDIFAGSNLGGEGNLAEPVTVMEVPETINWLAGIRWLLMKKLAIKLGWPGWEAL
jgi:hypothetical protein